MAMEIYDRFSPLYWVTWGLSENETHLKYLQKFLKQVTPGGAIPSAGSALHHFVVRKKKE